MHVTVNPASSNPLTDSVRVLGIFIRAQVLIFAVECIFYAFGFGVAQVPWWPVMAIVCAVLGLIPYIGSLVGIGLVLLAALAGGADVLHIGIAAAVWVGVQVIEGFWLTPKLLGKPLGLRPLVVFLALLAGSLALGPLGVFVAVPAVAIGVVWIKYFKRGRNRIVRQNV